MEDLPFTTGIAVIFSKSMFVMDLMVLIVDTPAAPPSRAALAGTSIEVMFGVILAMKGILVWLVTASQYFLTSSDLYQRQNP